MELPAEQRSDHAEIETERDGERGFFSSGRCEQRVLHASITAPVRFL